MFTVSWIRGLLYRHTHTQDFPSTKPDQTQPTAWFLYYHCRPPYSDIITADRHILILSQQTAIFWYYHSRPPYSDIITADCHILILSPQTAIFWYYHRRPPYSDIITADRHILILSPQTAIFWYYHSRPPYSDIITADRHILILSPQTAIFWYYHSRPPYSDIITADRHILILSLQTAIFWYYHRRPPYSDIITADCHILILSQQTAIFWSLDGETEFHPASYPRLSNILLTFCLSICKTHFGCVTWSHSVRGISRRISRVVGNKDGRRWDAFRSHWCKSAPCVAVFSRVQPSVTGDQSVYSDADSARARPGIAR